YQGTGTVGVSTDGIPGIVGVSRQSNGQIRTIQRFSVDARFTLFTRGTNTCNFRNISVKEVPGNHQLQATTQSRPLYQVGPPRPVFDGVDDSLVTTFAAALGANCTVGRYVPG